MLNLRPEEEVDSRGGIPFALLVVAVQEVLDLAEQGDLLEFRRRAGNPVFRIGIHHPEARPFAGRKIRGGKIELVAFHSPAQLTFEPRTRRGHHEGQHPALRRDPDAFRAGMIIEGVRIGVGKSGRDRRVEPPRGDPFRSPGYRVHIRNRVRPLVTDLVMLVLIEIRPGKNRFPSARPVIDPRLVRIHPFRNKIGAPGGRELPVALDLGYRRYTESSSVGGTQFHPAQPQLLEHRHPRGNLRSRLGVPVDPPAETRPGPFSESQLFLQIYGTVIRRRRWIGCVGRGKRRIEIVGIIGRVILVVLHAEEGVGYGSDGIAASGTEEDPAGFRRITFHERRAWGRRIRYVQIFAESRGGHAHGELLRDIRFPSDTDELIPPFFQRVRVEPTVGHGDLLRLVGRQDDGVYPVLFPDPVVARPKEGEDVRVVVRQIPVAQETTGAKVDASKAVPPLGICAFQSSVLKLPPARLPPASGAFHCLLRDEVHHPEHRVRSIKSALGSADDLDTFESHKRQRADVELPAGWPIDRKPVDHHECSVAVSSPDADIGEVAGTAALLHHHTRYALQSFGRHHRTFQFDLLPRHDAHIGGLLRDLLLYARGRNHDGLHAYRLLRSCGDGARQEEGQDQCHHAPHTTKNPRCAPPFPEPKPLFSLHCSSFPSKGCGLMQGGPDLLASGDLLPAPSHSAERNSGFVRVSFR